MQDEKKWKFWKKNIVGHNFRQNALTTINSDITTLSRELIQNSLDAYKTQGQKITVVATVGSIPMEDAKRMFSLDNIKEHIEGSKRLLEEESTKYESQPGYKRTLKQLDFFNKQSLSFFKFSDYGTKGIDGCSICYSSKKTGSFWTLLADDGVAGEKGNDSLGGAGAGKLACFPFSVLSTVFYSTKYYEDNSYGLAGVTRLFDSISENDELEGKGFFAHEIIDESGETLKPLNEEEAKHQFGDLISRNEPGTDVIVVGLDPNTALAKDGWTDEFSQSTIENFFPAIIDGFLSVEMDDGINKISISTENDCRKIIDALDKKQTQFDSGIKQTKFLIDAYTHASDNIDYKRCETEIPGLGKITLFINKSSEIQNRYCVTVRWPGMTTVEYTSWRGMPAPYAALIIIDKTASQTLLNVENEAHNKYDERKYPDGEEGKKIANQINAVGAWVRERIIEFTTIESKDNGDTLIGLEQIIALDEPDQRKAHESADTEMQMADQEGIKTIKPAAVLAKTQGENLESQEGQENNSDYDDRNEGTNKNHKRNEAKRTISVEDENGKQSVLVATDVSIRHSAIINCHGKTADFAMNVNTDGTETGTLCVDVRVVGEDDIINSDMPPISKAFDEIAGTELKPYKGHHLMGIKADTDGTIKISIEFARSFVSKIQIDPYVVKKEEQEQ